MTSEIITAEFGNRLRVRAVGILIENDSLLLVKHKGLGASGYLWAPPGGGVEFGTPATQSLEREFLEETGIVIEVKRFLFACELISPPFHAVELFFSVDRKGGQLTKGFDPELNPKDQIIEEVRFHNIDQLRQISQPALHHALTDLNRLEDLLNKSGYYII